MTPLHAGILMFAYRMTQDTIADRLGVFSIHVPGSPVGQGRPVIGSTGYMSLSPTRDIQPSTQLFPKSRPAHTARQSASLTREAERILQEHDAVGEQAFQAWLGTKGAEYERKRAQQLRIKAHAVEQFRRKEAAIQAEADQRFQAWSAKKYEAAKEAWAKEQEEELVRSWNKDLQRCRDEQYTGRSTSREPGFSLRNDPASQLPCSFDGFEERLRKERLQQQEKQAELERRAQRKEQQRQATALLLQQQQQRRQQQQQARQASQSPTSLPSMLEAPHNVEEAAAAAPPELLQQQQQHVLPQLTPNHSQTLERAPQGPQGHGAHSKELRGSPSSPNSSTPKLPPTHASRHLPAQHSPHSRPHRSSRHSPRTSPPPSKSHRSRASEGSHRHPPTEQSHPHAHDFDKGQSQPQHPAAPGPKSEPGPPPGQPSLGTGLSGLQTLDEMLQVPGLVQSAATPPQAEPSASWRHRSSSNSSIGHLNQLQSEVASVATGSRKSSAEWKGSRRRQSSAQGRATAATAPAAEPATVGGASGRGPSATATAATPAPAPGSLQQPDSRVGVSARYMTEKSEGVGAEEKAAAGGSAPLLPQSSSLERSTESISNSAQVPTEGQGQVVPSSSQQDVRELEPAKPGLGREGEVAGGGQQTAAQVGVPDGAAGIGAAQAAQVSVPSGEQGEPDSASEVQGAMGVAGTAEGGLVGSGHGAGEEGAGWDNLAENAAVEVASGQVGGGAPVGGAQTLPTVQEEAQREADAQGDLESVGSRGRQQQQEQQGQHGGSAAQQHNQLGEVEPEQQGDGVGTVHAGADEEDGVQEFEGQIQEGSERQENEEEREKEEDEYSEEGGGEVEHTQDDAHGGSDEYTVEEGEEERELEDKDKESSFGAEEYSLDEYDEGSH
ncbi:hypothetical protein DUNSADRAFT_9153 [Dunaliella salina]|uniref:Uncharacterized protein n=1 Tax=Dunaliella salina TaxID=3046 RepID=A0ABQ7GI42_DUNSA|nr:hypothetical protein DUNSADRAFT_9153 [Dunaliella salina]|eukprot:KAF5834286.1 hypothetical protein DUNSADRAFT_9153 [Dunaliella salina]